MSSIRDREFNKYTWEYMIEWISGINKNVCIIHILKCNIFLCSMCVTLLFIFTYLFFFFIRYFLLDCSFSFAPSTHFINSLKANARKSMYLWICTIFILCLKEYNIFDIKYHISYQMITLEHIRTNIL